MEGDSIDVNGVEGATVDEQIESYFAKLPPAKNRDERRFRDRLRELMLKYRVVFD
jgi:hypothetical protein